MAALPGPLSVKINHLPSPLHQKASVCYPPAARIFMERDIGETAIEGGGLQPKCEQSIKHGSIARAGSQVPISSRFQDAGDVNKIFMIASRRSSCIHYLQIP
jgi:hypothetical protein